MNATGMHPQRGFSVTKPVRELLQHPCQQRPARGSRGTESPRWPKIQEVGRHRPALLEKTFGVAGLERGLRRPLLESDIVENSLIFNRYSGSTIVQRKPCDPSRPETAKLCQINQGARHH